MARVTLCPLHLQDSMSQEYLSSDQVRHREPEYHHDPERERVRVHVEHLNRDRSLLIEAAPHGIVMLPAQKEDGEFGYQLFAWGDQEALEEMTLRLVTSMLDAGIVCESRLKEVLP